MIAARGIESAWLGRSAAIQSVLAQVPALARSSSPLHIEGEAGTGKGRLAGWIHACSDRAGAPFQTIDCTTIPREILGRELFGHEAGAFTDARQAHPGRLRAAEGGTVLFQGIENLEPAAQRQLLRVYEQGEVMPIGATRPVRVNLRFIQTSQAQLRDCVERGLVRPDLYYRMHVLALRMPPLRERPEDIPHLVERYLERESARLGRPVPRFQEELWRRLRDYPWPGNLPELEHAIVAILTLCPQREVGLADLPQELRARLLECERPVLRTFSIPARQSFHDQTTAFQRALIQRVWRETGGDRPAFLAQLDLAPHQLKYLLAKLDLELPSAGPGSPVDRDRF